MHVLIVSVSVIRSSLSLLLHAYAVHKAGLGSCSLLVCWGQLSMALRSAYMSHTYLIASVYML